MRLKRRNTRHVCRWGVPLVAVALVIAVGASNGEAAKRKRERSAGETGRPKSAEDLVVVDCLLPGQVRRLGRQQTYVSRRRPIRTTALDCAIRGGEYVSYDRADYRTALRVWLESAESGDADAQYYVGEIYERGLGTDPDYVRAAEWYRKAAEQGHAQAQINLGYLLEQGLGVEADPKAALDWYRKATGVSGVILLDSEVERIRTELSETHRQLAEARDATEVLSGQLDEARGRLASARAEGREASDEAAGLERRVAELEHQLDADRGRIASLADELHSYDVAGPTIEIIDTAAVRSAGESAKHGSGELVGRVEAPAGLSSLTANGSVLKVQDDGFFRFRPEARRVTLVAVDLQGKREQLIHDLDAAAEATEVHAARVPAKYGPYHALVIGNTDHRSLPRLASASRDATAIADVLRSRYGFGVTVLQNATYLDVLSAFSDLRSSLAEKDNLIIYYAGHGELDAASGMGYWLPVDAESDSKTNWMSSREISLQLSLLPCRHVLVIADSCYSGALTRSSLARVDASNPKQRARWIDDLAAKRSRTALTSGGLSPVLDQGGGGHSIFARSLLDELSRNTGTLETLDLWAAVKARVMYETRSLRQEQVPEYAPIRYSGHEGGEFFFVPERG